MRNLLTSGVVYSHAILAHCKAVQSLAVPMDLSGQHWLLWDQIADLQHLEMLTVAAEGGILAAGADSKPRARHRFRILRLTPGSPSLGSPARHCTGEPLLTSCDRQRPESSARLARPKWRWHDRRGAEERRDLGGVRERGSAVAHAATGMRCNVWTCPDCAIILRPAHAVVPSSPAEVVAAVTAVLPGGASCAVSFSSHPRGMAPGRRTVGSQFPMMALGRENVSRRMVKLNAQGISLPVV